MTARQARSTSTRSTNHLRPRKSLGQNFLQDENICRKIIAGIAPAAGDIVVEIGPGEGALTKYLAESVRALVVIDVDKRVIELMLERFPAVIVLHQDFLETSIEELARLHNSSLRIVGNIPYNITSPILFHVLDHRAQVFDLTIMIQKEVARRMVAKPGTKDYGILSVFCQMFADVELLFDVSPNAFYPKPTVTSSVVQLTMLHSPRFAVEDEQFFRSMVRSVFGKRRKTLRNSLSYFVENPDILLSGGWDLTKRPEDLTIEQLAGLSNELFAGNAHVKE